MNEIFPDFQNPFVLSMLWFGQSVDFEIDGFGGIQSKTLSFENEWMYWDQPPIERVEKFGFM